jgi:membrane fusion protein (multidrug efflux system)
MDGEESIGKRKRLLRLASIAGAVVIGVAAIGFAVHYTQYGRYIEETNNATIQADQVAISSKLSGYVRAVAVAENETVAQGATLIEIDPTDYDVRVSAAAADVDSALAAANASAASRSEAQAGVLAARADLQAAQASLELANQNIERFRPLTEAGFTSPAQLSQLRADQERAAANVARQRAALVQAERRVGSIHAQTAQLSAQANVARLQQVAAANDLAATRIAAPIAGRVTNSSVRIGQFVQPGVRLMTIVPSDDLYIVANFKETQVELMRPGQPARIEVDALPGVIFPGEVISITPGTGANFSLIPPQNATGNFTKIVQRVPVRIRINAGPTARRVLAPGLSLTVEVDTRAARDELTAIRNEQRRAN